MTEFVVSEARISQSPEQTEALAGELASGLEPGQVVLVEGELGAGKTTFVRGACRALHVTSAVRSPTFTIGHLYRGSVTVAHIDLYRIGRDLGREEPDLLADYLRPDTIAFVEWPPDERGLAAFGPVVARVRILHAGGDQRRIEIEGR